MLLTFLLRPDKKPEDANPVPGVEVPSLLYPNCVHNCQVFVAVVGSWNVKSKQVVKCELQNRREVVKCDLCQQTGRWAGILEEGERWRLLHWTLRRWTERLPAEKRCLVKDSNAKLSKSQNLVIRLHEMLVGVVAVLSEAQLVAVVVGHVCLEQDPVCPGRQPFSIVVWSTNPKIFYYVETILINHPIINIRS